MYAFQIAMNFSGLFLSYLAKIKGLTTIRCCCGRRKFSIDYSIFKKTVQNSTSWSVANVRRTKYKKNKKNTKETIHTIKFSSEHKNETKIKPRSHVISHLISISEHFSSHSFFLLCVYPRLTLCPVFLNGIGNVRCSKSPFVIRFP